VSTIVTLRDVLPRDGLQDLDYVVPTPAKVEIIARLRTAGLRWIEVSSMVSPRWVPQFADAEAVVSAAQDIDDLRLSVFVPNTRGLQRALQVGVDEVSLAIATTNKLSEENFAMSHQDALAEVSKVARIALDQGVGVTVTIGAAFACPFEGPVDPARVLELVKHLIALGVENIFLADTIGAASPTEIGELGARVVATAPAIPVGIHLHVRHDSADGVVEAVRAGAINIDVSTSGIGGCPFIPDPPGNVSATAVAARLAEEGIDCGQQLGALQSAELDVQLILEEVRERVSAKAH